MHEHPDRRHILFVDDDLASRRIVERVLRAGIPGARVTCASDGVQALQTLESEDVDLLITDLTMPNMGGMELLRQLTGRRIAVPVIVVTAHGSPGRESRALADGAFEYFEKPLDPEPFVRCVQQLLDRTKRRSRVEGISIAGFVQLLGMERMTCALRASIDGAQGVLYFSAGALIDARQAELSGAEAALEIFTWQDPLITLEAQSRGRPVTIHMGVTELLLESARLVDERARNLRRSIALGRATPRSEPAPPPANVSRAPALSLVPPVAPPAEPTPASPRVSSWEQPAAQASIAQLLAEVGKIEGVTAAAVAHWEFDQSIGCTAQATEAAANCRVMRALMAMMSRLGLESRVQDILITLDEQSHFLWPLARHDGLFLYLAVERTRSNLALTRHRLHKIVEALAL